MAQVYNRLYTPELYEKVCQENKDICTDFLQECKAQKKAATTQKQYANDLRWICCFVQIHLEGKSFLKLTKRSFRDFVIICDEKYGLSAARINRLLAVIHQMLEFCENDTDEYEDYERNASEKVKGLPKEKVREIVFLSNDTIMKLYNYLMDNERYKEATLIGLAYESTARKNELRQVLKDTVTDDRNCTNICVGKRGKKFPLIYFELTKKAAKKYMEQRGKDDIPELFITAEGKAASAENIYDWIVGLRKVVLQLTGEDLEFGPHSLRHSGLENYSNGTHEHLVVNNMEALTLDKLKLIARHNSVETTSGYLKQQDDKELEELFGIKLS